MSSIRVAPSRRSSVRAHQVLSKWAVRHSKSNEVRLGQVISPADLIDVVFTRKLAVRERIFERQLPFSLMRFFIGLGSLVLVFSDILRSGLSVSNLQSLYPVLQPDEVVNSGTSWNHSVFRSTKDEAINCTNEVRVWSYKFDTTSISWRAFGSYLGVQDFPKCFFYHERCTSLSICGEVAFRMIDGLVNAIANVNTTSARIDQVGPTSLTLRTQSEYIDRLHQFLLPSWFPNVNWRTNQALYYSSELLSRINSRTVCFPAIGSHVRTPRFCNQLWANFNRSCASTDSEGRSVGLLYVHMLERVRSIQARFPNSSVDLTILESFDDLQVCKGGLSALGFRWSDVSTIVRARNCTSTNRVGFCETVYVDDYRYETGSMTTDVVEWYRVIAALRIIGQGYFVLRGIGLMVSCYYVYTTPRIQLSFVPKLRKAAYLFMKVPTQCVVYGSPFPVVCYVLAHLLDASFTYQALESNFITADGVLNIQIESFMSYAVVQMRNVWVYTLAWHFAVSASTSRWMGRDQLNNGIVGVPEFLLSAFSSMTLVAQYRSTSFRSSKLLSMMELPNNLNRSWEIIKYRYGFSHRGRGNIYLGGVIIDLKFLACLIIALGIFRVSRVIWLRYLARVHGVDKRKYSEWGFLSPTPVPYSAGTMWPTVSMCVHWTSDFFCIHDIKRRGHTQRKINVVRDVQVAPLLSPSLHQKLIPPNEMRDTYENNTLSVRMSVSTFRYIQHQMKCLHGRSDTVEANVAFMNVVLMSDPLVYLLMVFDSTQLGYYQSIWRPNQILLLPTSVVGDHNEYSHGLKLLKSVYASDLTWPELVQCG